MRNFYLGLVFILACTTGYAHTVIKEILSGEPVIPNIRIVTEDFPPFQYMSGGKVVGPMYEVMVDICITAKLLCQIILQPWVDTLNDAESGKADVIFSVLDSPKRREQFDLADPIISSAYSAFVLNSNNWRYVTQRDLSNRLVGAYGPSGTSTAAEKAMLGATGATLRIVPTMAASFQQLTAGVLGADGVVIANKNVGLYFLQNRGIAGTKLAGDLEEAVYTFGVSKKANKSYLLARMNNALRIIQARGQIDLLLLDRGLTPAHLKADSK